MIKRQDIILEDINQLIFIGKITKPVGFKGHIKVIPLTDFPERFKKLKDVFLFDEKKDKVITDKKNGSDRFNIKEVSLISNFIKLKLEGYDDINETAELINKLICIDEKKRVKLPKGLYYYYEMEGCTVYEDDMRLGEVARIDNFGSSDILFIKTGKGNEVMIPLLKEFVKKIDVVNQRIDVKLIEGLIDYDAV